MTRGWELWCPAQDRFAVILDGPESCCCCRWSFGLPNHRWEDMNADLKTVGRAIQRTQNRAEPSG